MPRRARRLNSDGLQPSRSKTSVSAGAASGAAVRSGASGPGRPIRSQRRKDVVLQRPGHAGVEVLVQAQQGPAAERVDPVAGRGGKAELLARHEVLRKPPLPARVDLHVPVHRQRGDRVAAVRHPVPRERVLPALHAHLVRRERPDLAPQRLGLRAAVQAENRAPFPGASWRSASGLRTRAMNRNASRRSVLVSP